MTATDAIRDTAGVRRPRCGPQARVLWIILLVLLPAACWPGLAAPGAADRPALHPADAARLQFRVFRDQDGLPQNSAQTLAVDAEGRIWVGTQDGAAVYNGRVWRVVDMPSKRITNSVRIILQASNGDLWFGCDGAVNRLRGDDWATFTRNDGVPEGWTRTMLELPGANGQPEIWIGTDAGFGRFDGASWTEASRGTPLEGASVRTLTIDDSPCLLYTSTP